MKTLHSSFFIIIFSFFVCPVHAETDELVWFDGQHPITYSVPRNVEPVVSIALEMFRDDMRQVTGMSPVVSKRPVLKIVQGKGDDDGFSINIKDKQIVVEGHNPRGTAYGILELSRLAGVSPWIWWGDVVPERRQRLTMENDFSIDHIPSVAYRGIFLNDEDWSLRPWSYENYEPGPFGHIGPKTYRKIFELLLRLRANAIWPGMHTGTTAFFKIPGTKAVADSFGIVIGTSHCEPLLRNNVDEWNVKERGAFNYNTNRDAVQQYWIERLKEVKKSKGNMFTIGMRGIHDGSMEGYKTMQEKFNGLQQVIDDQQELLDNYIGNPSQLPQVFVPYKEVLQLYEMGLRVPDYVTLVWCDDNYGYMTRLSNPEEQKRKGGAGVYYHLSYWGRPHDYLWLTTTQPGLVYHEMRQAYDHQVRKLWIVNVHDPKVAGYDLELFLDMAWDIDAIKGDELGKHYQAWLCRQFGNKVGQRLFPVMHEFFRLCGQRRPEFMGWNQVEVDKKTYDRGLSQVRNTEFSGEELDNYLHGFKQICLEVGEIAQMLRPELLDAYFAAIQYPVQAAAAHAEKLLEAQRARQLASGSTLSDMFQNDAKIRLSVAKSQRAYQIIRQLTDYYNNRMSGGKWRGSMNDHPRDLPVFWAPLTPVQLTDEEVEQTLRSSEGENYGVSSSNAFPNGEGSAGFPARRESLSLAYNACDFDSCAVRTDLTHSGEGSAGFPARRESLSLVQMLGHSMNAVVLCKGTSLTYRFVVESDGDYLLRTALIPTQPSDNGDLRFSVSIDGGEPVVFSLKEPFRSERWKLNVLRGQALREQNIKLNRGLHTLTVTALDEHIVFDQWMIEKQPVRQHYLIPARSVK